MPVSPPVVRMTGVSIGYGARQPGVPGTRPAVRDVDFALEAGEVVALLGPNGAGKSTLIRGMLGLNPLLAGQLELFGTPAAHFTQRYRLGYVPQRHTIVGGVPSTVREVVSSGRLARKRPFAPMRAADRAAVAAAIDVVGLSERADLDVAKLSGGQQRRVLIARALAAEPDMFVMDEPTAGVDAANQEILAATLSRLVADGSTLLLVAHELGPLEPLVQRVVVMRDGRVTYQGPPLPGGEATYAARHDDAHHNDPHHRGPHEAPGYLGLTGRPS